MGATSLASLITGLREEGCLRVLDTNAQRARHLWQRGVG